MSYFSLLGDSLNTALSAVGNIVAPVDGEEEGEGGDGAEGGRGGWGGAFDIDEEGGDGEENERKDQDEEDSGRDGEDGDDTNHDNSDDGARRARDDYSEDEDAEGLRAAIAEREARIADLERYNGMFERRVDELEEQVRFLDGKGQSLGIELAESRWAGEAALGRAVEERTRAEAELREQLDRSLDEWTRAEERIRELEAALASSRVETEAARAQSSAVAVATEGPAVESKESSGTGEMNKFAAALGGMIDRASSPSGAYDPISMQAVLDAMGGEAASGNDECIVLAARLSESLNGLHKKIANENNLRETTLDASSLLSPLVSAMGAEASLMSSEELVAAACRAIKEAGGRAPTDIAQESSQEFVSQLETSLADRDLVISDLSSKIDGFRDDLRAQQSAVATAKEQEAALIKQCTALEEQVQSLTDALRAAKFDLTNATKSSADEGELRTARAQIQKMEHEQRQLHQVIAQLRQTRKSNREDADSLVAERDALKRDNELFISENANIKMSLSEKQSEAEILTQRVYDLSTSYDQLSSELERLQEENRSLYNKYEERDSACKQLSKSLFDVESKLETLQSDLAMVRQDLDFKSVEVQNLNLAIDGMERESERRLASTNNDFETRLERLANEHRNNILAMERSLMQQVSNLQAALNESKQREVDEGLLRRKAEMEWVAERRRLQTAVESAMRKLQNSSEDVVDRAVVANLIVSYFRKRKSKDILDLIARMLQFTEEQKAVVGLIVAPAGGDGYSEGYVARQGGGGGGGGGVLTSLLGGILGGHAAGGHADGEAHKIKGDSLAEMWVNFLLEESGGSENGASTPSAAASATATATAQTLHNGSKQEATAPSYSNSNPSRPIPTDSKLSDFRPDPIRTNPPMSPTRDSYASFVMTPESPKVA